MVNYVIAEIAGKQYKVLPKQVIAVHFLGDVKKFDCEKVLLKSEDGKLEIGTPYTKTGVSFEVLEGTKRIKTRVATYKAKANTRKVIGQKTILSMIRLEGK